MGREITRVVSSDHGPFDGFRILILDQFLRYELSSELPLPPQLGRLAQFSCSTLLGVTLWCQMLEIELLIENSHLEQWV